MHLSRFPRVRLAHLPTPLEPAPRLSEALGVDIWIKRWAMRWRRTPTPW